MGSVEPFPQAPSRAASSGPAEDDVYVRLRADVERAVAKVCPGWLSDKSEDLVQNAMIKVMDVQRKCEGKAEHSSSYLYRAAHSVLVDEIRRLRRRREVPIEDDEGEPFEISSAPGPERRSLAREIGRGIRDCLSRLVEPRRLAVTLHLQGHSVPESARLLGWNAKRTENLVYRGLANLRQCLEEKGLEP